MSIFWSSIMILGVYIGRKKNLFTRQMSIISIFLLYVFSIFRALVPVDVPFSKGIYLMGLFSKFYKAICINSIQFLNLSINLFQFFLIIWLFGSMILLVFFARKYSNVITEMHTYEKANTPGFKLALDKVKKDTNKTIAVEILISNHIVIPLGIGIVNKKIVLPQRIYEEEELYYIVLHEYTHIINHDLLIKMFTQFYCYFFWWNPIVYLLKADLAQTLEIKCDLSVTENMNTAQKIEYLTCIVNVLKRNTKSQIEAYYGSVALVAEESDIVERFKIVSNNINAPQRNRIIITSFLAIFTMIAAISYLFVFQPQYESPQSEYYEEDTFEITAENNYILLENGSYFVIYGDNERSEIAKEGALQMESQGFEIIKGDEVK